MNKSVPRVRESVEELEDLLKREKRSRYHERIQALYFLRSGQAKNRKQVADLLCLGRNTIGEWLRRYEDGGLPELLDIRTRPNRPLCLPPEPLAKLQQRLKSAETFKSYLDIQKWIEDELNYQLPYSTVHQLVRYRLKTRIRSAKKL